MILYIITWTCIYTILIFLLHNLYLFFQNNLTTTKNRDYYNTIPISIPIPIPIETIETNVENIIINSKDENTDFTSQMKYELNDFIRKMEK